MAERVNILHAQYTLLEGISGTARSAYEPSVASMQSRLARSYLFIPGNRPERFDKACAAEADAVIVDLEDAVPPEGKLAARAALAAWQSPAHPVLVRINDTKSEWFHGDLEVCGLPGVTAVVLAKTESAEDVDRVVGSAGAGRALLPLIETATGFANLEAIARHSAVERLLFGSIDFQLDLGISGSDAELLYFRSHLVLVSRLAGKPAPVDGVTIAIDDVEQLRMDTMRARKQGFGGKLCIHPKQVPEVNRCFSPTPEEIAWASRVLEAASKAGGAAVALDGKMIDRPVILNAERILRETQRAPNRAGGVEP
jgi:citrate lyase subunit beta / citryl-CoA lyase